MPEQAPRPLRAVVLWTDGRTGKPKRKAIRIKKGDSGFDMPKGTVLKKGEPVTIKVWWG